VSPAPKKAASPQNLLSVHPLASMFPMMKGEEFDAFVADIETHGLHERITLYQGKILEGRHRYRACLRAKVEPRFKQFKGDDAAATAFVVSRNIHRRHLKPKEKRDLLEKLLKADPQKSNRQIAKATGVSHPHIAKVRKELEKAGDVETVTTSIDTKGRRQTKRLRAPKAKATPAPTVEKMNGTEPLPTIGHAGVNGVGEQKTAAAFLPVRDDKNGAVPSANAELEEEIEELRETKQRLKIEIEGLKSEIEELNEARSKARSLTIEQRVAALVRLLRNEPDAKRIEMLKKLNRETVIAKAGSTPPAPAPETPPTESPLKGNDPGPLPECLRRETPTPASSRTSQR
jgi:DNA-binding Lrp family transcriptional regulator